MKANPQTLFASRLEQARKMQGLSLRALADQMQGAVTYAALHKYEKGAMLPGSGVLIALAAALHQSVDFFFRPLTVSLEKIEFRKRSALRVKEEEGIKQKAADFFERYLEVENLLGLPEGFQNPLKGITIRKSEDIETTALKLREVWKLGLDALPNVLELLEDNQFKIYELDAGEKFDGFSGWAGHIPVVVLNRQFPNVRKRLTALHEVAHLLLDFPKGKFDSKEIERLCHNFAGAMLIPEEMFIQEFGGKRAKITVNELLDIKTNYGISIGAIMARAKWLGLITESYYQHSCITMRQRGWHKVEPGEFPGQERSNRFDQLLNRAASTELVSLSKAAALAGKPLAEFRDSFQLVS